MGKYKFNTATGTMELKTESAAKTVSVMAKQPLTVGDIEEIAPQPKGPVMQKVEVAPEEGEPEVTFKERSDITIVQFTDIDTNTIMGYISGYALDISFNKKELNSVARIEECLDAIKSLFRKVIMDQIVGSQE